MNRLAIVHHSARGHTGQIARQVRVGTLDVDGVDAHLVTAEDIARTPDRPIDHDGLSFGSPTDLGGVSRPFKSFRDSTGRRRRTRSCRATSRRPGGSAATSPRA